MVPQINIKETGINLRLIMDKRGITPRKVKEYLKLGSVQSVYNWFNELNMPTIDNLYALSQLLQVPIDEIIGTLNFLAFSISNSFALTVSMASMI